MKENNSTRSKLSTIKNKLTKASIPWIIFAGAAAHCYGSQREITDIDILLRCEDLEKAKAALRDIDLKGFDIGCGAEILTPQGKCRFFLDEEMIEKTVWKQLNGITVPVMSVEDNIILKAILQRGNDEGKHDIEDIRDMVKMEKIDVEYLKYRIHKCSAEKRIKPLLRQLGIL